MWELGLYLGKMMDGWVPSVVEISSYRMGLRGQANARAGRRWIEGCLCRIDGGYACLQTWPELGGRAWRDELGELKSWMGAGRPLGSLSGVLQELLRCARVDGLARFEGVSLLAALDLPPSYFSIASWMGDDDLWAAARAGFAGAKLKVDGGDESWGERLRRWMTMLPDWDWRLDFNATGNSSALLVWWQSLGAEERSKIRYLEDPLAAIGEWSGLEAQGMTLAEDWLSSKGADARRSGRLRVIKPSVEDWRAVSDDYSGVVVTSNMQHPLGQMWDTYQACMAQMNLTEKWQGAGLVTHGLLAADKWTRALGGVRPVVAPEPSPGLGFEKELESLSWQKI